MAIISNGTTIANAGAFSASLGSQVLIKEITASSDATVSFVDGASSVVLDNTYPIYVFKFINMHPSEDGRKVTFQANASGGSGYNETITSTFFLSQIRENDSNESVAYNANEDQGNGTSFQNFTSPIGNGNDESGSGELWLYGISSTTFVKHFMANFQIYEDNSASVNTYAAGYFNTTSALDEFQFKFNSGNIDSGTIKLYGIKDA